jgi:SAM-dependent methyltransferase
LERTREHWLLELAGRKQALVLGDGDGRFLAKLLAQEPVLTATAVDISASMLGLLNDRCAFAADRLHTVQASALSVDPPPATDLIVTHFFLDCLTQAELDTMATRFATATQPGTLWLVSDFDLPPSHLLRPLAALYIRALYLAFRCLTGLRVTHLPAVKKALTASGFERIARQEKLHGLLYTEIWMRR